MAGPRGSRNCDVPQETDGTGEGTFGLFAGLILLVALLAMATLGLAAAAATPSGENGEAIPPPPGPPLFDQIVNGTPGYAGATAGIPAANPVDAVGFDVRVPNGQPAAQDNYYALMSVYDSADFYDQVGLAAWNGGWEPTWANLAGCGAGSISLDDYGIDSTALAAGKVYHFEMQIGSLNLSFRAELDGALVWSRVRATNASWFDAQSPDACGNESSVVRSFTVYEEIWRMQSGAAPPWGIDFQNVTAGGRPVPSWSAWTAGVLPQVPGEPQAFSWAVPDGTVEVWNAWFRLEAFAQRLVATPGVTQWPAFAKLRFAPGGDFPADCGVDLCKVSSAPNDVADGWKFQLVQSGEEATHGYDLVLNISSCTGARLRTIPLQASDGRGLIARVDLLVEVTDTEAPVVQRVADRQVQRAWPTTFQGSATDNSGDFNETGTFEWSLMEGGHRIAFYGQTATYSFPQDGNVSVTLTVRDCFGNAGPARSFVVEVVDPPPPPAPGISTGLAGAIAAGVVGGAAVIAIEMRRRYRQR